MVKENLAQVMENIENACKRSNRDVNEVTLIAVSKTKPVEMISEAIDAGVVNFGENKVQELTDKMEYFKDNQNLKWHMIGHLQSNKVKYIIDKVSLIHSVDSYSLAQKISEQAVKKNVNANILIEVNVAMEESKFGLSCEDVKELVIKIGVLPNITVRGLMTVAPYVENPEENREIFRKLKKLCVDIKSKNIDNITMDILSMGMTNDYEIAIEEGSTMVRVGTGIFGNRNYNI